MQQPSPARHEQIAAALHQLMNSYGYERLETPILQPADLFLTRAGDQIITRLFTFERGGKQLALRPEYTSTALSLYCEQQTSMPARWQFGGLVFEDSADAPHHQRHSIGAEVFGIGDAVADAEIVEMSLAGLTRAGISDTFIVIGHVALLRFLVSQYVADARIQRFLLNQVHLLRSAEGEAHVYEQIDKLLQTGLSSNNPHQVNNSPSPAIMDALLQSLERSQLMGGRTREDIQRRLQRKLARAEARPQIEAALAMLKSVIAIEGTRETVFPELRWLIGDDEDGLALLNDWAGMLDAAETLGVDSTKLVLAPGLSRNWDYYSGIVFELHGSGRHLGGGGRYDELARLLGSPEPVPAVGFAYYVDEIMNVLPDGSLPRQPLTLSYDELTPAVAEWLSELRSAGLAVAVVAANGTLTVDAEGSLRFGDSSFALTQAAEAIGYLEAQS